MTKFLIDDKKPNILKIPLNAHLVKFLKVKYGKVYRVSNRDWLGVAISNSLTRNYVKPLVKGNSYLEIVVPNSICEKNGYFFNPKKLKNFETIIATIFISSMCEFTDINIVNGVYKDVKKCIEIFLSSFDIREEDFSLDTAYRNYHRYTSRNNLRRTVLRRTKKTPL